MANIVLPGEIIGSASTHLPGRGTLIYDSQICASLAGAVTVLPVAPGSDDSKQKPTLLIQPPSTRSAASNSGSSSILPEVESVVLARVRRISKEAANVGILVVGERVVGEEWAGVIRVQDVRATEKDRVKIMDSFRPGDIVRAVVISLGDQSNYYLSTARNELGVVIATSAAGNQMYPVSWKEFADAITGEKESRKVAKPF